MALAAYFAHSNRRDLDYESVDLLNTILFSPSVNVNESIIPLYVFNDIVLRERLNQPVGVIQSKQRG